MTVSKEESKAIIFCKLLIVALVICAWIVQWPLWTYGSLLIQIASGAFIVAMSLLLSAYTSPVWLQYFRKRKSTVRKKNAQNAGNKNYLSIAGIKIPYWVLGPLIFAIPFVWIATQKTIENFQLSRKGQVAMGVVREKYKVGSKGTHHLTIEFLGGSTSYIAKASNEIEGIGDSIKVIYLPGKPEINRAFRFINDNYDTDNLSQ